MPCTILLRADHPHAQRHGHRGRHCIRRGALCLVRLVQRELRLRLFRLPGRKLPMGRRSGTHPQWAARLLVCLREVRALCVTLTIGCYLTICWPCVLPPQLHDPTSVVWDIKVVQHEIGHNFNSYHTHVSWPAMRSAALGSRPAFLAAPATPRSCSPATQHPPLALSALGLLQLWGRSWSHRQLRRRVRHDRRRRAAHLHEHYAVLHLRIRCVGGWYRGEGQGWACANAGLWGLARGCSR